MGRGGFYEEDDDDQGEESYESLAAEAFYRRSGIDLNHYPQPGDGLIFNIFEEMGWTIDRDAIGDITRYNPSNRDPKHDRSGGYFYSLYDAIREVYEYTPIIEFTEYYYDGRFWHLYVRDS